MIVAVLDGQLARGQRGRRASCPGCRGEVYGREPQDAIAHWAHMPTLDQSQECGWDHGMTEWHRVWQSRRTDLAFIEVYRKPHRADVINAANVVIEFQHSYISHEDMWEREQFWGTGIWVLDGTAMNTDDDRARVLVTGRPNPHDDSWVEFRWRRTPPLGGSATWPCWVDLGNGRGLIQVFWTNGWLGTGWLVPTEWFVENVVNGTVSTMHEPQHIVVRPEPEPFVPPTFEGVCCGNRHIPDPEQYPDRVLAGADPAELALSCQLCPESPIYWRKGRPDLADTKVMYGGY